MSAPFVPAGSDFYSMAFPQACTQTDNTTLGNFNVLSDVAQYEAEDILELYRDVAHLNARSVFVNQVYLDVADPDCPRLVRLQRTCGGFD